MMAHGGLPMISHPKKLPASWHLRQHGVFHLRGQDLSQLLDAIGQEALPHLVVKNGWTLGPSGFIMAMAGNSSVNGGCK